MEPLNKHHPTVVVVKKFSVNLVILLICLTVCIAILLSMANLVFNTNNPVLDNAAFSFVDEHVNPGFTKFIQFITLLGGHTVLLPANIILISAFLFNKRKRFWTWKILAIAITGVAVLFSLKGILERQRPLVPLITQAHGYSFPSGHAFSSCVFYGMLAYIAHRSIKNRLLKYFVIALLVAVIIMVGYSRVYLRVHYATDVIAGWALGIIWLLLAKWLLVDRRKNFPHDTERAL